MCAAGPVASSSWPTRATRRTAPVRPLASTKYMSGIGTQGVVACVVLSLFVEVVCLGFSLSVCEGSLTQQERRASALSARGGGNGSGSARDGCRSRR